MQLFNEHSHLLLITFAFFMVYIIFLIFKSRLKGKIGEWVVQQHVRHHLDNRYILLNNITLPDGDGTTQIDHILLSPYGLFVIETKNYRGWIYGEEKQKMWTQKIYKNNYKFQNPIHQNYKHIKVIETYLLDVIEDGLIHSIVVFMPDCEFKTQMPTQVFKGRAWIDYVLSFQDEIIPIMKLKRIQMQLEKNALDQSWKTHRVHIENLKLKSK